MASGPRAILGTFNVRQLRALAAEHGVDTRGCRTKTDFVKRMARAGALRGPLQSPRFRVRPVLAAKTTRELRAWAREHRVNVRGCKAKADFVDRIAASSAAPSLLPPARKGKARARAREAAPPPDLSHPEADALLDGSRNVDIDFRLSEDVLEQARMRFEERNFDRALELAHEALLLGEGSADAFGRASWAYALLASERLLEESAKAGRDVGRPASLLRDAKVAYLSGNLAGNRDLLVALRSATKSLYSEEVQRLRAAIESAEETAGQVVHIGGDVGAAEEALARTREALERAEHAQAFELVDEAERLAKAAMDLRVKEIGEAIPTAATVIEEAGHVGADVEEATKLLEQARVALKRKEYVLAGELVQRAERSALQGQHYQIQRAMELRRRQIERAEGILVPLQPVVDEATDFGVPVGESRRLLREARRVLAEGDYVSGTLIAKQAEEAVRRLAPRLVEERSRRGIVKPTSGRCPTCGSVDVAFHDDGWSHCRACGASWRWRRPLGLWERFRSLLRE